MKHSLRILPLLLLAALAAAMLPARGQGPTPRPTVKISLDSATLLMGRVTPLHVELLTDRSLPGYLHSAGDTLTEGVEVAARTMPDTVDLGNGRIQINQDIYIQSFDSGEYAIPPVMYIVGNDTFASNGVTLSVVPVNVDSLTTIHDYAAPATIKAHFWDWVPQWITDNWGWLLAGLILIIGAAIGYYIYRKKMRGKPIISLRPAPKPIPPYELAIKELNTLREEHLCENGHEKEYYTRLTDILRRYIDKRFGINAVEMTSEQILRALRHNDDTRLSAEQMRHILQIADYVKFAKLRPFSDDNAKAFTEAVKFVEDTRPVPVDTPQSNPSNP